MNFQCPSCSASASSSKLKCFNCGVSFLAGRYLLADTEVPEKDMVGISIYDCWCCNNCGALRNGISASSCMVCKTPWAPQLLKASIASLPSVKETTNGMVWLYQEDKTRWVLVSHHVETKDWFEHGLFFEIGFATHKGQQNANNEDAVLVLVDQHCSQDIAYSRAILAIADGMGGHAAGEIASRKAIVAIQKTMSDFFSDNYVVEKIDPDVALKAFENAAQQANQEVFNIHSQQNLDLGTTLTGVFIVKNNPSYAIWLNVGDSRTYLYRAGSIKQLSSDHSLVWRLVQKKEIQPDDIYTHPDRNKILRVLGHDPNLKIDAAPVDIEPGDQFIICCDGVWEMLHTSGIADVMQKALPSQEACDEIVVRANLAGGEDNISVIIVKVRSPYATLS